MADYDKMMLKAAQEYRAFWNEHPVAAVGLGFIPIVGTAQGLLDTAAAKIDPEASKLELGLASASILPFVGALGRIAKRGGGAMDAGSALAKRLSNPNEMMIAEKGKENLIYAAGKKVKTRGRISRGDEQATRLGGRNVGGTDLWEIVDELGSYKHADLLNDNPSRALGDIMPDMGELYVAYPWLKDMPVNVTRAKRTAGGSFDTVPDPTRAGGQHGSVNLNIGDDLAQNPEAALPTLMHEIQHAIQNFEGLPLAQRGSAPKVSGTIGYSQNPGEVMARVADQRRNWTFAQRKDVSFADHLKAERARALDGQQQFGDWHKGRPKMEQPDEVKSWLARAPSILDTPSSKKAVEGAQWRKPRLENDEIIKQMTPDELQQLFGPKYVKRWHMDDPLSPSVDTATSKGAATRRWMRNEQANGRALDTPEFAANWDDQLEKWMVQDDTVDGWKRIFSAHQNYGANEPIPFKIKTNLGGRITLTSKQSNAPYMLQSEADAIREALGGAAPQDVVRLVGRKGK